jgi:hypothetical protein
MGRRTPWPEKIGEGVVIVASILLAFGIQAWWDDRREAEEERRMLTALLLESQGNAEWLSEMVSYYQAGIAAADAIQEAAGQTVSTISSDSVDALLATLTGTFTPPLERGALDAVLVGGRIDVIADEDLRRRVAAWERGFRGADSQAEMDVRVDENVWTPVLQRLGSLPQIAAVEREEVAAGLELPSRTSVPERAPVAIRIDHRALLREREFLNAVQQKRWAYEDALYNQSSFFVPQLDSLIQSLQSWLVLGE